MTVKANKEAHDCKTPLKIFVIWHPEYTDGKKYAESLFRIFSWGGSDSDYRGENIGIPVYFLTTPSLDFDAITNSSDKVAFVLFTDNKMVIGKDSGWGKFAYDLFHFCNNNASRIIYPVVSGDVTFPQKLCSSFNATNAIKLGRIAKFNSHSDKLTDRLEELKFILTHELCRLLFNRERIAESALVAKAIAPSVKVFVSHAKKDGEANAKEIDQFIANDTALKTFFDVKDIPKGSDFGKAIEGNISDSVLLAIHTDAYSSREWCQKEILFAKTAGCPIIVVDALEKGESRRFPYGANAKAIHLGHGNLDEKRCRAIVLEILIETLKIKYNNEFLKYLVCLIGLDISEIRIFSYPPELYTLLMNLSDTDRVILYPEPPLNNIEMDILKKYKPGQIFSTPVLLPCIKYNMENYLSNMDIGISVSALEDIGDLSKTNLHLTAFYTELCRYLFAADANLSYAGDVNYKDGTNFVDVLRSLIRNYCFNTEKEKRIKIFRLSDNFISDDVVAAMMPEFEFIKVDSASSQLANKNIAKDLTTLRENAIKNNFARIVLGGKTAGYDGRCPGIIEEAYIALENNVPLFVLGAYGGSGECVADLLLGKKYDNLPAEIVKKFNDSGLAKLNNGLSVSENEELIQSSDIARNLSLIIKGLKTLSDKLERCDE